jgi:hypothetical protein
MASAHFEVFVSGGASSIEDWRRAMNAPKADLPKLNEEQREVARKMGISEEEYARGVLTTQYGAQREKQRGENLGQKIAEILRGADESYRLEALVREGTKGRWVARIGTGVSQSAVAIAIGLELADDVIDSATVQDVDRLKRLLLEALGRKDLLGSLQ